MKKEIPYYLKSQYYVEKIPLYLRENYEQYWLELFNPLEEVYLESLNFNQSYYDLLKYYNQKENKYKPLPLLNDLYVFNKEQRELEWWWNKFENDKNNFDKNVWYNKFYYKSLVHYLMFTNLTYKNNWRQLLNLFNLKDKLQFLIGDSKTILSLSNTKIDELTKIIFKQIVKFKYLKIDEITITDDNINDWKRKYLPYFNRSIKKDNKIIWESAMNNVYFYDVDYGNIFEEKYE